MPFDQWSLIQNIFAHPGPTIWTDTVSNAPGRPGVSYLPPRSLNNQTTGQADPPPIGPVVTTSPPREPAGLNLPQSREGSPIAYVCGTVRIEPNLLWYGNINTRSVVETYIDAAGQEAEKTTLIDAVDVQLGLCTGPGIHLIGIYDQKNVAIWTGDVGPNEENFTPAATEGLFTGTCTFYGGEFDQPVNALLAASIDGDVPAFVGTSYLIIKNGNRVNSFAFSIEVQKLPNPLALTSEVNIASNGKDINLATMVVDFLTAYNGGGYTIDQIDTISFAAAAATLATENNFGSCAVSSEGISASDLIASVEDQSHGIIYLNPATGKIEFKLYRTEGVDLGSDDIPVIDASKIINHPSYTKSSWESTNRSVRLMFSDRAKGYAQVPAKAETVDVAASNRVRETLVVNMPMVADSAIAADRVAEVLQRVSTPQYGVQVSVSREFYNKLPGDVVKVTWGPYKWDENPMFVTGRSDMSLTDNLVKLNLLQFNTPKNAVFVPPEDSGFDIPSLDPLPPVEVRIITPPAILVEQSYITQYLGGLGVGSNEDIAVPLVLAIPANVNQTGWGCYFNPDFDSNQTMLVGGGDTPRAYAVKGTLVETIGEYDGVDTGRLAYDLHLTDCTPIVSADWCLYAIIGDEWFEITIGAYNNVAHTATLTWTTGIPRGMMDTVKQAHVAGSEVWLVPVNRSLPSIIPRLYSVGDSPLPKFDFVGGVKTEGATTKWSTAKLEEVGFEGDTIDSRWNHPLRPHDTRIDGAARSSSATVLHRSMSYTISWFIRSRWYYREYAYGYDGYHNIAWPPSNPQNQTWLKGINTNFPDYAQNDDNTWLSDAYPIGSAHANAWKELDPATLKYVQYRVMLKDSSGTEFDLGSTDDEEVVSRTFEVIIPSGAANGAGTLWVECYNSVGVSIYKDTLPITISA